MSILTSRAPRRPLTPDEERELLPKEEVLCGEGALRAAQVTNEWASVRDN